MNCYLIAGGRSLRMGTSKAALHLDGRTFLERVASAASEAFDGVIAVVRHGAPPLVSPVPGLETIEETAHDDEAAIFGVARALEHAHGDCFVLAIDYPLITPELLRRLRARFEASGAPMLVPVHRSVPQTLCAAYGGSMKAIIDARIANRQYDLHSLAARAATVTWDGPELTNVNTPADLQNLPGPNR